MSLSNFTAPSTSIRYLTDPLKWLECSPCCTMNLQPADVILKASFYCRYHDRYNVNAAVNLLPRLRSLANSNLLPKRHNTGRRNGRDCNRCPAAWARKVEPDFKYLVSCLLIVSRRLLTPCAASPTFTSAAHPCWDSRLGFLEIVSSKASSFFFKSNSSVSEWMHQWNAPRKIIQLTAPPGESQGMFEKYGNV